MGVLAKIGRCRKTPEIQSQNRGEGVLVEEGRGLRRDICLGSKDDLHANGAEYSSQHEPRGRATGREDDIPSR